MDSRLISLAERALSLDEPSPAGWDGYLAGRGIAVVVDDLGRPAITRGAARELITEHHKQHREHEARLARVREQTEQAAIAADREFRASLPGGIPWYDIPVGVTAPEMWAAAEKDAQPKRRTVLEDALDREQGLTYHPISGES
jgi:ParB-like chromosome segregation protein Spo0J